MVEGTAVSRVEVAVAVSVDDDVVVADVGGVVVDGSGGTDDDDDDDGVDPTASSLLVSLNIAELCCPALFCADPRRAIR